MVLTIEQKDAIRGAITRETGLSGFHAWVLPVPYLRGFWLAEVAKGRTRFFLVRVGGDFGEVATVIEEVDYCRVKVAETKQEQAEVI